jgi:hypothetical protein
MEPGVFFCATEPRYARSHIQLLPVQPRVWPSPRTIHLRVVSDSRPIGP